MPRRFEFQEDGSNKFWEIEQQGTTVTTWWGRIGTAGQSKTKAFGSDAEATKEYNKLVAEKTKKGYAECGGSQRSVTQAPSPMAAAVSNVAAAVASAAKSAVAVVTGKDRIAELVEQWNGTKNFFKASSYLKVGVPLSAVAARLDVPEELLGHILLIRKIESNDGLGNGLTDLGLQQTDAPKLRKAFMHGRVKYLWLQRNATISDDDERNMDFLVTRLTNPNGFDVGSLLPDLGPDGAAEFIAFYRKWLEGAHFEQQRVFGQIEKDEPQFDKAALKAAREALERQIKNAGALTQLEQHLRQTASEFKKVAEETRQSLSSEPVPTLEPLMEAAPGMPTFSENVRSALDRILGSVKTEMEAWRPRGWNVFGPKVDFAKLDDSEKIFSLPPAEQAEAVAAAAHILSQGQVNVTQRSEYRDVLQQIILKLYKKPLPYTSAQVSLVVSAAAKMQGTGCDFPASGILSTVEQFVGEGAPDSRLAGALTQYSRAIAKGNVYGMVDSDSTKAIHRINLLVARTPDGKAPLPIAAGEWWSDVVLAELDTVDDTSRNNWKNLLNHCMDLSSTKPSSTWLKRAQQLVTTLGEETFIECISRWFGVVSKASTADEIGPSHADILKGLAWSCAHLKDPRIAVALGDAAEVSFKKVPNVGPRCPKLGNAGVHVLAQLNTKEAVAQLTRVQAKAKHASVRTQIEKALDTAATKSGMSKEDLQDIGVPDYGMQEVGKLLKRFGSDWTAELVLDSSEGCTVTWITSSGKRQQSVPAQVKADFAADVKAFSKLEKDIEKLMPGLRARIERSLIEQRHWTFEAWRDRYLNHPVVGAMARRLLWNFNGKAAIYFDGKLNCLDGSIVEPEDNWLVELWHPISSTPQVVLDWRRWLAAREIVQPFKQVHREIYVLTDAERGTADHSNRFAGHIIRQHQFQNLCAQRGWQFHLMGAWDSHNTPTLELPKWDLTAEFWVDMPEGDNNTNESFIYNIIFTEQVVFSRKRGKVQLTEIMPVVFSEVMRDVDLFVSVCSIGVDPNMVEGDHAGYWHDFSFGELNKMGEMRKQVLEDIIPSLKIGPRCRFENNFLIVKGDIRSYKIHLGSGKILMEPNDEYLCIVQSRGATSKDQKVFLPFEGDGTLAVIISKALMLADDTKITDPSIVSQLRRGM